MIIYYKIEDEKLQHDINETAVTKSALLSDKIDKYEYLADKEILPPDQSTAIEEPKFTYFPLAKDLEKQTV